MKQLYFKSFTLLWIFNIMESIIILKRYVLAYFVFSAFFLNAQSSSDESFIRNYQLSSEQYISGIDGKVYMNVHIWGAGGTSGTIRVHEGIDFASLMSAAGVLVNSQI